MPQAFPVAAGHPIDAGALTVLRAREFARVIMDFAPPFVRLLECRRREDGRRGDVLVLEIEVELPQRTVYDIQRLEPVAAVFWDDDEMPETLAMRPDFPLVPHLNLTPTEFPRSLCLYDKSWSELKLLWTARGHIERIREWLALTARGELHAPDQPMEPLLLGSYAPIVLPDAVLDGALADVPQAIAIYRSDAGMNRQVLIAAAPDSTSARAGDRPFVATVVRASTPQPHGIIRHAPANLNELHQFLLGAGDDLLAELRLRLDRWREDPELLKKRLVLILVLPKTRVAGGPEDGVETRAFLCMNTVSDIGEAIDVWQISNGHAGHVLIRDPAKQGADIGLVALNPVSALSRSVAARLNGPRERAGPNVVAIGAGALGSQVFMNLVRTGWGEWTLVDDDHLLPHNLARNALDGAAVGLPKAAALAVVANSSVDGPAIAKAIVTDVLRPGDAAAELDEALRAADAIVDMSASVPVARHLASDLSVAARRISLFLNPLGTDLVILAEDRARTTPLDALEMQYYGALLAGPNLAEHIRVAGDRVRYGGSCRDLSAEIPQERVALHAAIGSRALRETLTEPGSRIAIWQADPQDLTVRRIEVPVAPAIEQLLGEWRLQTNATLGDKVARMRQERLPNETGGVLIGTFDLTRKIAYVVDVLPSPADSAEWPTNYIRGSHGLAARVREIGAITDGQLGYVGEWHTHPSGHGVAPSGDDRKAFTWLAGHMALDGLPPLFLILGDARACGWYLAQMPEFG